jgi:hypothetical protein
MKIKRLDHLIFVLSMIRIVNRSIERRIWLTQIYHF